MLKVLLIGAAVLATSPALAHRRHWHGPPPAVVILPVPVPAIEAVAPSAAVYSLPAVRRPNECELEGSAGAFEVLNPGPGEPRCVGRWLDGR